MTDADISQECIHETLSPVLSDCIFNFIPVTQPCPHNKTRFDEKASLNPVQINGKPTNWHEEAGCNWLDGRPIPPIRFLMDGTWKRLSSGPRHKLSVHEQQQDRNIMQLNLS